jgi:hypothetical protein
MAASKYRGVLHCLQTVARHEGILGLQKGLVAGTSHTASRFPCPDAALQA